MAENTINWPGNSGHSYMYWIHPLGTSLLAKPGNYAFAKETRPGFWVPLYFGQTSDLSGRFDSHHALVEARQKGATHIHAHINEGGDRARLNEEADLCQKWKPSCNG